ncbi:MAG: orotate phosphoribosyltransferase [Pseudomonadales bacterium]|nr:orotate phosphoribosyltransferase [Pseudomonadales bacterium]
MQHYKSEFIQTAVRSEALCFGEFTLKSGRISPYFFNAGKLYQSSALSVLAKAYAQALHQAQIEFDVLFGPAYKGISLSALTAAAYYDLFNVDISVAYNRKEKKAHGEGGQLVGAPLANKKVVVIDDVITAGTAIREVADILKQQQAELVGVLIGLDRCEKGKGDLTAVQEVEADLGAKVFSIISLPDIEQFIQSSGDASTLQSIQAYRKKYA